MPGDNVVQVVSWRRQRRRLARTVVRLVYPRQTIRGSGALDFTLEGGTATRLEGFAPALTHVLDVTDPDAPVRLETWNVVRQLRWSQQRGRAPATSSPTSTRTRRLLPPSSANRPSSWHTAEGADLVILGPAALFGAVQPLVDRRRRRGCASCSVDIEDLQDEFASGEKSVDSVRGFLQYAVQSSRRGPPPYLLLLGSAPRTIPRDYLGLGGDLVSSAVVQTDALRRCPTAGSCAFPGPSTSPIGRLPVRTVDETRAVVAKILESAGGDARSPVLLASDALGTSDFPEMTADLRASLPGRPGHRDDPRHRNPTTCSTSGSSTPPEPGRPW